MARPLIFAGCPSLSGKTLPSLKKHDWLVRWVATLLFLDDDYRIKACALRFQHLFPATYGLLGGTPRLATRSPSGYLTTIRQLFDNYMTTYLTTYLTTAFPLAFRIHGINFMRFPRMSLPLGTACAGNYKKQGF